MRCAEGQPQVNMDRAIEMIRRAAAGGAEIVCLPELFRSEYFCQKHDISLFDLAEPIPGPSTDTLSQLAAELKITIEASLFEKRAPGLYHNSSVILLPNGEMTGLYRKSHIPHDPLFYEKYYFTPGDTGFLSTPTPRAKVGVLVCWDQWYPEAARLFALRGAEILLYPTAIGWLAQDKESVGKSQHEAWETMMRSHAIANGVFVAAANRVGHEDSIEFWGASFAFDPAGNLLYRASHNQEELVMVRCDLDSIDTQRTYWPFMRDRRIDAYGDLTKRWVDG